jgi:hypothetical protein
VKINNALILALIFTLVGTGRLLSATLPDRLMPLDPEESKYRAVLHQKLCLTPFDCGRIIVMPPFRKSEISVSVYSRRAASGKTEYYATSLEATDNLRDSTNAGRSPAEANKLKVRRIDVRIPAKTAGTIKEVWKRMISAAQRPRGEITYDMSYGDPTMLEFCISSERSQICGDAEWVPTLPERTHKLSEFAVLLPEYCRAHGSKRAAVARNLDRQATALLNALGRQQ